MQKTPRAFTLLEAALVLAFVFFVVSLTIAGLSLLDRNARADEAQAVRTKTA